MPKQRKRLYYKSFFYYNKDIKLSTQTRKLGDYGSKR